MSGGSWQALSALGAGLRRAGTVGERQAAWLAACLARNRDSDYGRAHGFGAIHTVAQYRAAVPLTGYEEMAPWIARCAGGEADVIFAGRALAFERTGGSSGGAKLLPYSAASLDGFRVAILPWLRDVIEGQGWSQGHAYWAISPATRQPETTAGGIAVGVNDAAYLGADALPAFAALSAVEPAVGAVASVRDWQLLTLHGLLCKPDLVLISVWSPTFFLALIEALDGLADEIEALLAVGGRVAGLRVRAEAGALERLRAYRADHELRGLWPRLALVSCWADGDSRPYFDVLRARLPHASFQAKGLLATEGVVTVPDAQGRPVLAADSGFTEFIDARGNCLLADELRAGERYEVVMTTAGGLYRYRIGDVVDCQGHGEGGPLLHFVGRAGLVSDLVGEKLTAEFVARCLADLAGFRMLVRGAGAQPGYALIVDQRQAGEAEALAERIEQRLHANPQYAYARRMGQLARLAVYCVADPLNIYFQHAMGQRARMGDVKMPVLRPEPGWLEVFLRSSQ